MFSFVAVVIIYATAKNAKRQLGHISLLFSTERGTKLYMYRTSRNDDFAKLSTSIYLRHLLSIHHHCGMSENDNDENLLI